MTSSTAARLFCIPHAGGSASIYRPWRSWLPAQVDLCPIELPGRGPRIAEPPLSALEGLVGCITDYVLARTGPPFALFGHSLGALLAFESARVLQACGIVPAVIFASGHRAPQLPQRERPICHLADRDLLREIAALGGTSAAALQDGELIRLIMPALRADFTVSDTYLFRPGGLLRCPVIALGGASDPHVRITELQAWGRQTSGPFRVRIFPGGHFFPYEQTAEITRELGACWWQEKALA